MNNISNFISIIYAVLLIVGGAIGFLKAKSIISLISGALSGLLVLLAYKFGTRDPKSAYLYIAAISLCLAIFFLIRYSASQVFIPSGLMFLLSTTTFVVIGLSFLKSQKK